MADPRVIEAPRIEPTKRPFNSAEAAASGLQLTALRTERKEVRLWRPDGTEAIFVEPLVDQALNRGFLRVRPDVPPPPGSVCDNCDTFIPVPIEGKALKPHMVEGAIDLAMKLHTYVVHPMTFALTTTPDVLAQVKAVMGR
jgi:hypothetical protein